MQASDIDSIRKYEKTHLAQRRMIDSGERPNIITIIEFRIESFPSGSTGVTELFNLVLLPYDYIVYYSTSLHYYVLHSTKPNHTRSSERPRPESCDVLDS